MHPVFEFSQLRSDSRFNGMIFFEHFSSTTPRTHSIFSRVSTRHFVYFLRFYLARYLSFNKMAWIYDASPSGAYKTISRTIKRGYGKYQPGVKQSPRQFPQLFISRYIHTESERVAPALRIISRNLLTLGQLDAASKRAALWSESLVLERNFSRKGWFSANSRLYLCTHRQS